MDDIDKMLKRKVIWKGKLQPTFVIPNTQPMALTSAQCRRVISGFLHNGISAHSPYGATLWCLLDYLQAAGIPYQLNAMPGIGYEVRRGHEFWKA